MTDKDFYYLVDRLREQTFHMYDHEAKPVIDEFLKEHPKMLENHKREWFTKYC